MARRQIAWQMAQSLWRVGKNVRVVGKHGTQYMLGDRPSHAIVLRRLFEDLGATYIKIGQFIASAPSVFPVEFVTAFQDCLDKTPPVDFTIIRKVIEAELGGPWQNHFARIEVVPLACASIAQVHRATTHDGRQVVVKVQKPGVENIIRTDLFLVQSATEILEFVMPHFKMMSLAAITSEIKKGMEQECDFLAELRNLIQFREFLKAKAITSVTAPEPLSHLCSRRLLTMEHLDGVAFTNLEEAARYCQDPEQLLIDAMNAWFGTLLEGRPFHADVHAGNLLILKDGRVAFIDFGIVGRVRPQTWNAAQNLMHGLMSHDYQLLAQSLCQIGMTEASIDVGALSQDLEQLMTGSANNDSLDRMVIDLAQTAKRYDIHFPREFALLLKQLLYFDRYIQLISPESGFYDDERLIDLTFAPGLELEPVGSQ